MYVRIKNDFVNLKNIDVCGLTENRLEFFKNSQRVLTTTFSKEDEAQSVFEIIWRRLENNAETLRYEAGED